MKSLCSAANQSAHAAHRANPRPRRHLLAFAGLGLALACGGAPDRATASPHASSTPVAAAAPRASDAPSAGAPATPSPAASSAAGASAGGAPATNASAAPADANAPGHFDAENVYGASSGAPAPDPKLFDATGRPLPQSDDHPSANSAAFDARIALLGRAITSGNADVALPAFFPSVAYAQVKDIPEPEKDWERRLVGAFRRDVAEYHAKLGDNPDKAVLVRVEVPEGHAKLMKPGSEGNRVGYHRVLRSKLTFRLPTGKERSFEVTSMISWRGEWYVVHLHGFK